MLCEVTKEWDWMEGGDSCPVTKLAANLRRDLDPRWFENINEYQAGNVMDGGKKDGIRPWVSDQQLGRCIDLSHFS